MKQKTTGEIKIVIDGIPPNLNNYVRHTRSGIHYKTQEARDFETLVALAAGEHRGKRHEATEVYIRVCLGPGQRGDIDNFPKIVLDSLVRCEVIRSDASLKWMMVRKERAEKSETKVQIFWEKLETVPSAKPHPWRGQWNNTAHRRKP